MAQFKCKMCGGSLEISAGTTVIECEYCGTQQTLPKLDDEKRANMYDRANHFRRNNEFDKAMGIYENILNEDNTDAEAYWSLVLCRYGIEYVEDPVSRKRIPTINRAQFTSIFDDDNYKSALQYADSYQRALYEEEAKTINEIQRSILSISQKEDPFDVFICYKESDNNGRRTADSVLAQDLYFQLKQEGFKVFFARITLEDKLGSAYEPYIFAALNTAKVMVVLGTKPEFFNAVWVKNEWSRYLSLIKQGQKKMLIPAYKDMDPYDLPEEFSHLQAQDMSKLGFMQDLIRGIEKIIEADNSKQTVVKETVVKETVVASTSASTTPLIKRVFMFLEDSKWGEANEYCEKVLDIDPECADAYLGKLLAELRVTRKAGLESCQRPFDQRDNYNKIKRFGDQALIAELDRYNDIIRERNEENRKASTYEAGAQLADCQTSQKQREAAQKFETIPNYRDAKVRASACYAKANELAEIERKDAIYDEALQLMKTRDIPTIEAAIKKFQLIGGWKDSEAKIKGCHNKIEAIRADKERARIELEMEAKQKKKRKTKVLVSLAVFAVVAIVLCTVIGSLMRSSACETLSGKTLTGTYSYYAKSFTTKDTYTIYFIDEEKCDIYCIFTCDEKGSGKDTYSEKVYRNVPYAVTGGVFGLKFNWDKDIGPYHSAEPFRIKGLGSNISMYTPNFNSSTSMRLNLTSTPTDKNNPSSQPPAEQIPSMKPPVHSPSETPVEKPEE
jgi:hypothetical protein